MKPQINLHTLELFSNGQGVVFLTYDNQEGLTNGVARLRDARGKAFRKSHRAVDYALAGSTSASKHEARVDSVSDRRHARARGIEDPTTARSVQPCKLKLDRGRGPLHKGMEPCIASPQPRPP
jgi:hypothetical protein